MPRALVLALLGLVLASAGCAGFHPGTAPAETADPGHGSVPYELLIDNTGTDEARRLTVAFYGPGDDARRSPVFAETVAVEAGVSVKRDVTVPEAGTYRVAIRGGWGATATHEYEVGAPDPATAIVVAVEPDGGLQVATYHP